MAKKIKVVVSQALLHQFPLQLIFFQNFLVHDRPWHTHYIRCVNGSFMTHAKSLACVHVLRYHMYCLNVLPMCMRRSPCCTCVDLELTANSRLITKRYCSYWYFKADKSAGCKGQRNNYPTITNHTLPIHSMCSGRGQKNKINVCHLELEKPV